MMLPEDVDEAALECTCSGRKRLFGKVYRERYRLRGERSRIVFALAPTDVRGFARKRHKPCPQAVAGTWRVIVENKTKAPVQGIKKNRNGAFVVGGIEVRIQRDESFGQGNTGARQSYLRDPLDKMFWSDGTSRQTDSVRELAKARRFGSLNGLATGKTSLVVAGYNAGTKLAAPYSGAGSLRYSNLAMEEVVVPVDTTHVDISATAERNQWLRGIVSNGTRSGTMVAANGTSSAAPQVSRLLVELFASTRFRELVDKEKAAPPDARNYLWLLEASGKTTTDSIHDDIAHPASAQRLGSCLLIPGA